MIDYSALKAADAALGISDLSEAAAALNAQTVQTTRDVPCDDARSVLYATGEFGALVMLSRETPSDAIPKQLVAAAVNAVDVLRNATVIQATDAVKWGAARQMLGAFLQAGAISQASYDALVAMRATTIPRWPLIDAGILQTARAQP